MELFDYMLEMSQKGYFCAQILMNLALEYDGKDNPDLVRAMSGLNGGLGFCGGICGVLTGGCAVLGYFAGKGEDDELESCELKIMIAEYVTWFHEYSASLGGGQCSEILHGDPARKLSVCPELVAKANETIFGILRLHGVLE
ncbi:MAG: C-GCAxxG-C-C family protein [Oscillospiraceae bacterium]